MKMRPRKLEIAGIVVSALEAAAGGQAANFYEIVPFEFLLNPLGIAKGGPFHPPGFLHSTGESDG